jgi:tetratricopeptide (TPR) repeat protein
MAFEQAQKLDPNLVRPASVLINYSVERGHLNEAWLKAQELYQRFPDESYSSFALSYVLRYAGLNEEAARMCDRTLALDKTKSLFRSCFIPYYFLGEYGKAEQVIREQEPGSTQWADYALGRVHLAGGDRSLALQNFKEVHDIRGKFVTACLTGVPVKDTAGQFESYATDNDPEITWDTAALLSYCGEPERAVRLTRSAIAHNFCGYPLIERDPLLASVRSRPEYSELRASAIACQQNFLKFRKSFQQK